MTRHLTVFKSVILILVTLLFAVVISPSYADCPCTPVEEEGVEPILIFGLIVYAATMAWVCYIFCQAGSDNPKRRG